MSTGQRQQQQKHLLSQATSHGPYLWRDDRRDVENALLWFSQSDVSSDASDNNNIDPEGGGCEFLRRLLHARGIYVPRPLLHSRAKKKSNKKRKSSSSGNNTNNDDDGKSNTSRSHKHKKQPKKKDDVGGSCRLEDVIQQSSSSLLQSVLMGYYQLFATPTNDSNPHESTSSQSKKNNFTTYDIQNASKATDKLLHDLNTIISARQHNNDIYNAYRNMCWQGNNGKGKSSDDDDDDDDAQLKVNVAMVLSASGDNKVQGTIRMSQTIDEYMVHPSTCTKRVYASKLFDRLVNLCNNTNTPMLGDAHDMTENTTNSSDMKKGGGIKNDALHKYLEKLFGLASNNIKIQEVIMLLVLEPFRRLQQQSAQEENLQEDDNDSKQQQQPVPGMDFSPMLTSASFWADTETIEKVYAQPLVPSLIHFILQSSPSRSPKLAIGDDNDNIDLFSTTVVETGRGGDKHSSSSAISWWALPSPLLCTISQLHFEIACKYIRYWIEMAVLGHDELYNTSPTNLPQSNDTPSGGSTKIKEESLFQHAMLRIKQFFSTSDRLHGLGRHTLYIMEKESKDEIEMSLLSEEEENAAYRRSLAWKAIHNRVY